MLQNTALDYQSLETWFPAVNGLKPVIADVVSGGCFLDFGGQYSASAELYYKKGQNQIDFIDHAQLISNPNVINQVRSGNSRAYGLELNLSKNAGKFTGAMSYTYSRVINTIDGINDGNPYSALSDIPHDFRINGCYQLCAYHSPKYRNGFNWSASVGIFNAYNRLNPLGYQFETDIESGEMRAYAYSMFGILPNVSLRAGW